MLSQQYGTEQLKSILIPQSEWRPFPTSVERAPWEALPEPVRTAHIGFGETLLGATWPELQAVRFLDYARVGNRSRFQEPHFARRSMLAGLVLAECMEGQGRFVDDIVNGVWAICEESYWGVPAHVGVQKAGPGLPDTAEPTVDLFAAETGALLAWTHYLLGPQLDDVSPLVRPRIQREIDHKILTPCFKRDDFWWMGFHDMRNGRPVNNWNPWINSNWLTATLLMETDADRRVAMVAKILKSVDYFIDPYPRDGGCDEGPSYWGRAGASLFDCLELLHSATNGQIDVYDDPLIQNIGQFIYRVQIDGDYFINFADAPAVVFPSPALVFNFGKRIGDEAMMSFGAWAANRQDLLVSGFVNGKGKRIESIGRQLPALFSLADIQSATPAQPLPRDVWLDQIEVMVARDHGGSSDGFFVAAKGGHNDESHNHNDIGNVVVYIGGQPIIVDAGVEDYTAKTFGPNRYDIWTMQSAYHSLLPTIEGVMQSPGANFAAKDVQYYADDASAQLTLDIAAAYPPEANLASWVRVVKLERGQGVKITDSYVLADLVEDMMLSLLTPSEVTLLSDGQIEFKSRSIVGSRTSGQAILEYRSDTFTVEMIPVLIEDVRLKPIWGDQLNRIIFRVANPRQQASWTWRILR